MNGIDKESLKNMSLEDMVRGLIDMVYHMQENDEKYWKEQPPKCAKTFVKVRHVKIAGIAIIAFLLGLGILSWTDVLKLAYWL